jgi:hypothetical protein
MGDPSFLQSESIAALAAALSKAQAEAKGPVKNKTNPQFKSKYAPVDSVKDAIRATLSPFGLSITQASVVTEPGFIEIVTQIMHSSGEWIRSWTRVPVTKNDPQGWGSAFTYAERRTLLAATCLAAEDEDDDGNAASIPSSPPAQNRPPNVQGYRPGGRP